MKVRSAVRTLTLAGTASLILVPGAVIAAPALGSWSATGGTVSGCPTGATCTVLVSEDGFLQQQVDVGGQSFFQTVVTDNGVTGTDADLDFASETFVEQSAGGTANGVMGRLTVNSVDAQGNGMTSQADLQTGNFATSGAGIQVNQAVVDGGSSTSVTDDFTSTLVLFRDLTTAGVSTGTDLQLAQDVGLDQAAVQDPASNDQTSFALRRIDGTRNDTPGSATLPAGAGSGTTGGGTVDWRAGEDVVVTWIGQRINLDTLGSQFAGYQAIQNLSSAQGGGPGAQLVDTFDFGAGIDTGPWDWGAGSDLENSFGTAPSL